MPVLFLVPGAFALVPLSLGLVLAVTVQRVDGAARIARSRTFLVAGRAAIALLALALAPATVADLADIVGRG